MKPSFHPKDTDPPTSAVSTPRRLPFPTHIRSVSLTILVVIAIIFTLQFAQSFFIPLVLGILIGYALEPIVAWMSQWKLPRSLSAGLVLILLVGGLTTLTYFWRADVTAILDQVPTAAQNIRERLRQDRVDGSGALEKMKEAAKEIERTAAEATGAKTPLRSAQPATPLLDLSHYLLWGSVNAFIFAGQVALVLFLAFFILASGDLYKRKLVKLAGPTLSSKRVTVELLDDINVQIRRFLSVQIFTSLLAAVLTWVALAWLGLPHAGVWGIAAGVGNFIPYIGPLIVAILITIVGFLQFGTFAMAALIAIVSLSIKGFIGFILTPWMMSKAARMNPVAAFIGLLFWGWVWGIWGMLLSMPLTMIMKVVCDRVENLKDFGELLGE